MKWLVSRVRKGSAVFALAVVLSLTGSLEHRAVSQSIPVPAQADRVGVPYDWSHRHLIFSQPASAAAQRTIERDPRYWQQKNRARYAKTTRLPDPTRMPSPRALLAPGPTGIDWSESLGTSSLNFNNLVNYPAKYSFNMANPTPDCVNDYVVYTLPVANSNDFNLIAFNNLYVNDSGTGACSGTTPSVLFAYNASHNNGPLNSSPVLSEDGTQIAFVENTNQAVFNVLKWKSGNVNHSTFGMPYNAQPLPACGSSAPPCEYSIQYSTSGATLSAPYIDYATDTAYVTDDVGVVTAISPVFGGGQPTIRFSVSAPSSLIMTPPVYDSVSKNVFAADFHGNLYYVRTAAGSGGTCVSGVPPCLGSPTLDVADNKQVFESPLVDSSSGTVFVFSNGSPKAIYNGQYSSVVQTTTTLSTTRVATIGLNGNQQAFAGTFNNNYLTQPSTGGLYACGTDSGNHNIPTLYEITFSGTSMNTGPAAYGPLSLATGQTFCSPLTEVFNQSSGQDELYLSVAANCPSSTSGGCVEFFDITKGFPSAATAVAAESGGTNGIIVDNVSGNSSVTNLYFVTRNPQLCTEYTGGTGSQGNCAVQLNQSLFPPPGATCVAINAVLGAPITPVTMVGSGGAGGPYTFTATGLPAGLTISGGGAISGTPTVSGTFNYTVTVTDSAGNAGTVNCSVTVATASNLICPSVSSDDVGVPFYSPAITISGGTAPYTFSVANGTLPAGLALSTSTGAITGTPTAPGTFSIQATDSKGVVLAGTCSFTISLANFSKVSFLERYAANLNIGESYIDITNTGANGASLYGPGFVTTNPGNICVNVYAFDPSEDLISCCSCLVTPDQTVNLGVIRDLTVNTLTPANPTSVTVKLLSSLAGGDGTGTSCANTAALVTSATLASGMAAWGTTPHATPASGTYATTETAFTPATLSVGELASIGNRCAFILGNGSGFGVCNSCRAGALGATEFRQ